MPEFDPVRLLRILTDHQVRFVVIGGIAARLRGAPLITEDVDVTPENSTDNLQRLANALRSLDARMRTPTDPDGVAFPIEPAMLAVNQSWTLVTAAGDLDLVFLPAGTAGYADLARSAGQMQITEDGSLVIQVAALADIIRSKEAAGREKDRAALPLLRRTLEETSED